MPTAALTINLNTPAPEFSLLAHTGKQVALGDYLGKRKVVLFFVRTYSCYSCRQHVEHLARLYADFQKYNAEILVILNADIVAAVGYADVTRAPFPILTDPNHTVYQLYGLNQVFLLSTRTGSVVINEAGIVTYARSLTNPWGWHNETTNLLAHLASSTT